MDLNAPPAPRPHGGHAAPSAAESEDGRVPWIDIAKGICIVFVVMLHANRYVQRAAGHEGWLQAVVDFARPFRMPDFFLISGLFVSRVIDRDWRTYLDKKVVHFAYFYVLWLAITCLLLVGTSGPEGGVHRLIPNFFRQLVQPTTSLWFIAMLPIFFVMTKLLRRVPWPIVLSVAAAMQVAVIETGLVLFDEGTERFVYFYAGYALAPRVFALASAVTAHPRLGALGLAGWAVLNGTLVHLGVADAPGVGLLLGGLGAMAVVSVAALLSKRADLVRPLRYCGSTSLAIYLAYELPMRLTKKLFFDLGLVASVDLGLIALTATIVGIVAPLLLHRVVQGGPLRWLFERPGWARLKLPTPRPSTRTRPWRPSEGARAPKGSFG